MDKLALWKAAPETAVMPVAVVVSRDQSQTLSPLILSAALQANAAVLPVFVGVDLGVQGYAVVKINKILPRPSPAEAAAKQDRGQYAQWWTGAENQAYYAMLKERFKTEIMASRPARLPTDLSVGAEK
jgi:peptidyl-prolyl cis-trans isomerase D